jgi:glucuronoarabinoxylan endo-1,4-beta-xylanase
MAPEVADWLLFASYRSRIEEDADAARYTDMYCVHQYAHPDAVRSMGLTKPLWQTEMSGLNRNGRWDPTIANGIVVAKWIHAAIVAGNVSAWVWWRALNEWGTGSPPKASDNEDLIVDVNGHLTSKPTIAKRLYTLGNFSKFIRPGSVRVGVGGAVPRSVLVSAYRSGQGSVAIVAINDGRADAGFSVALSGGSPPPYFVPWVTSAADNLAAKGPVAVSGGGFNYVLPARSVTTFVSGRDAPGAR